MRTVKCLVSEYWPKLQLELRIISVDGRNQSTLLLIDYSLAYTLKGCTPVEVLPVPNAYTNSFVVSSCIICISI